MWGRTSRNILIVSNAHPTPGLSPGFLHKRDIRLFEAAPQGDALAVARRQRLDLIIEDLPSPPEAGLALCRDLKADPRTRPIPVIVVAEDGSRQGALQAGADVVIAKPIVQREYFDAVRRFVPLPKRRVLRHLINLRFTYEGEQGGGQAFSRDLSLYGAFLKTDRVLSQGSHIQVQFSIPGESKPIDCAAIVRRTMSYQPHSYHPAGFGIEFEGISETDLQRLERFIARHEHRPLFSRLTK